MAKSPPSSVEAYLASLPDDRRTALQAVRQVILKNLDKDYEEGIQYGMIGYYVPHRVFPAGYHCDPRQPLPFASIASQKNHMAIYLCSVYSSPGDAQWFREAWTRTGKKLDMGKACVRFTKLENLPLDVIGEAIRRAPAKAFISHYESALSSMGKRPAKQAPKPASKKVATRKPAKAGTKTSKKVGKKVAKKTAKKPTKKATKKAAKRVSK